jgi:hypothetical protein
MKNAVYWDVTPFGSCMNRSLGGKYRLHHQGVRFSELGTLPVESLVTVNVVHNTVNLSTLM